MNVGAAEVDITPDFEVELCGFALREQPGTGVLDPIFAKAIYLDDERGGRLMWIVADILAFDGAFVACQSDPDVTLSGLLKHLPAALVAVRRELRRIA